MSKEITIITSSFPYGSSESFLEAEVLTYVNKGIKVNIIPVNPKGAPRHLVSLINVIQINHRHIGYIKALYRFLPVFFFELFRSKRPLIVISRARELFSLYRRALGCFLGVKELRFWSEPIYSYWMTDSVFILLFARKENLIPVAISRVHGYDLYTEVSKDQYIPFQKYFLKELDVICPISDFGAKYLLSSKVLAQKIHVQKLGTMDRFIRKVAKEKSRYLVVSCSNLALVKRVHLIPEILGETCLPIEWVHFGDGAELESLRETAYRYSNSMIFKFLGRVPNAEIHDFYQKHDVSLFINVSYSEGIPVSIMEASSYGIPVLATDAGGTSEALPSSYPLLFPVDTSVERFAEGVKLALLDPLLSTKLSEDLRMHWANSFNASKN
ncbi:MAG TPA: hypothetical protein DDY18_03225, partial [Flavobacterium sp.]|nr:hypothetical protein [Flavobacterium sp.]